MERKNNYPKKKKEKVICVFCTWLFVAHAPILAESFFFFLYFHVFGILS
jgi:hypothetical protein